MKINAKAFFAGWVALSVAALPAAAETVYWARVTGDAQKLYEGALAGHDWDIAAAVPGAHVDLVATADDLAALRAHQIPYSILQTIDTTDAPPSEYTEYHEMVPILQNLEATYPNICKLYDVGDTWEHREIWALKISDNPAQNEAAEKDILVNGCHHAREIMTVEVPLYLAQQLCQRYPADPDVKLIVDNVETWIIPMLNPDGHNWVFTQNNMWRKNRRDNGNGTWGVDLNRNYDYHWGEAGASHNPASENYCGPYAFSEPETQAIRDLLNNAAHQFSYTLNYHSYGRCMLIPWAYTYDWVPEPDRTYYVNFGQNYLLQTLSGWRFGNDWTVLGYLASGNAVDWEYDGAGHSKIWGFTFEIDTSFQPPAQQIPITCAEQYPVLIKLLKLGVCELGVKVSSFRAQGTPGGIAVAWETAGEENLAGFNLYRRLQSENAATEYVKLNARLIKGRSPYKYWDRNVTAGNDYEYLLEAVDTQGRRETFGPVKGRAPATFPAGKAILHPNWPNPTADATSIKFELREGMFITLAVYDTAGRRVRTLWSGPAAAGATEVRWNLTDERGQPVAPGVYIYCLTAPDANLSRRLVVIR